MVYKVLFVYLFHQKEIGMKKVIINNVEYCVNTLEFIFKNSDILKERLEEYKSDPNCYSSLWISDHDDLTSMEKAAFIYQNNK